MSGRWRPFAAALVRGPWRGLHMPHHRGAERKQLQRHGLRDGQRLRRVDGLMRRAELAMLLAQTGLAGIERYSRCHHLGAGHATHRPGIGAWHGWAGVGRRGDLREQDRHHETAREPTAEGSTQDHGANDNGNRPPVHAD